MAALRQSEADFQLAVIQYAQMAGGYRVYHTHNSKGSEPGFPDLICVRAEFNSHGIVVDDSAEAVIAELKVGRNKPTLDQQWWLAVLDSLATNVRAYLWTPDDWPEINRVLGRRRVTPAAPARSLAGEPRAQGDGGSADRGVGAGTGDARAARHGGREGT